MLLLKSLEIILENWYSLSAISEKIGAPSPPNLKGKDSIFLSVSEQLIPPDIVGINSVLAISFSCFSWLLIFGIVRDVGLCLNQVIKHKYAASGLFHMVFSIICSSDDCSEMPFAFCCNLFTGVFEDRFSAFYRIFSDH